MFTIDNVRVYELDDYALEDDSTDYGGVSYCGQTLLEFATDIDCSYTATISAINPLLKECGIKEITNEDLNNYMEKDRRSWICLK